MKYLVIGQARSRSLYLLDALSRGLGAENIYEPYKPAAAPAAIDPARDQVLKIQFNDWIRLGGIPLDSFEHIWFTYRTDLVACLASRILARANRYAYHDHSPPPQVEPFAIDWEKDQWAIIATAQDQLRCAQIGACLAGRAHTTLEYNKIPQYVHEQWGNLPSEYVPTGFDYGQLVLNPVQAQEWIYQAITALVTRSN